MDSKQNPTSLSASKSTTNGQAEDATSIATSDRLADDIIINSAALENVDVLSKSKPDSAVIDDSDDKKLDPDPIHSMDVQNSKNDAEKVNTEEEKAVVDDVNSALCNNSSVVNNSRSNEEKNVEQTSAVKMSDTDSDVSLTRRGEEQMEGLKIDNVNAVSESTFVKDVHDGKESVKKDVEKESSSSGCFSMSSESKSEDADVNTKQGNENSKTPVDSVLSTEGDRLNCSEMKNSESSQNCNGEVTGPASKDSASNENCNNEDSKLTGDGAQSIVQTLDSSELPSKDNTKSHHVKPEATSEKSSSSSAVTQSEATGSADSGLPDAQMSSSQEATQAVISSDQGTSEPTAQPPVHGQVNQPQNCSASTSSDQTTVGKPVKYRCPKCARVMKDKRLLANHSCEKEGSPEEEKVKITIGLDKEKKSFVCKECDFTNSGHGFEEHLMCHLMIRPYQCLYCKECFINRKEISRHVLKFHNGAKMSCALRALRRAKSLIKEVSLAGTLTFSAKVAGKVPLEKDPERKKKTSEGSTVVNNDNAPAQPVIAAVTSESKAPEKGSAKSTPVPADAAKGEKKVDKTVSDKTITQEETKDESQEVPVCDTKEDVNSAQNFSKLREVLTSNETVTKEDAGPTSDGETQRCAEEEVEVDKEQTNSSSDSGLKIIASYSLQDTQIDGQPLESSDENNAAENVAPNFIMMPPPVTEKETEVLSFLGPEKPMYKNSVAESSPPSSSSSSSSSSTPMLPPPPLQAAPSHSAPNNSSVLPPPPQLVVSAAPRPQQKNPNFFICGFNCLFSSLSTAEFREHTTNFHSSETFFPCYYCGHRSPNENDLVRHISNHTHTHNKSSPLYVCGNEGCRFGTNMVPDYINHVKSSHPHITEPLCNACGDVFPDVSMLQSHVEENVIHIVNCPHCSSKATDRRAILNHISTVHPGKPKMVSVAKQLICHDRKINNYEEMKQLREMLPPTLTPAPALASSSPGGSSVLDHILGKQHEDSTEQRGKSVGNTLAEVLAAGTSPRGSPSPSARMLSPSSRRREATPDSGRSPNSESSGFGSHRVKEEVEEDVDELGESSGVDDSSSGYTIDENGIRRRIYVPMSERQAENYRCRYCTFIARDLKRMNCHERSHGMPPTKKERFKCMFCPQGFDSEMKFRLHITCHPGLIKFLLYRCKKCEFDSNQKHTIVKHITCNRDRKHRGSGPVEDQYTVVSRSLESRVLQCEQCDYMTRHKIHMAIHYQREHGVLRDKGEFTIEGLTPTDTPLSSYDTPPSHSSSRSTPSPKGIQQSPDASSSHDAFDFTRPTSAAKRSRDRMHESSAPAALTVNQITERNENFTRLVSQQTALQPGLVLENQVRKFKCPICKYLLPKAADLKNHVKRHSEIGQITLVMFRCKYCSCMSTARELLYEHLGEKHPGKPIALVKKIVAIDTTEVDKSFAETSVEESFEQLEENLHKELATALKNNSPSPDQAKTETSGDFLSASTASSSSSSTAYEQLFVIPEGGDVFSVPLQCPKCSYNTHKKADIIEHVNSLHSEVKVISNDEDVEKLAKATTEDILNAAGKGSTEKAVSKPGFLSQEEVLIVPDDQIFKEPALCSRCDFATLLRRDMVMHLQQFHPEISVMGRNSYPVQVSAMGSKVGPMEESCVVGSGSLDAKIRCLYENYGTQMKCLICGTERPKKFFIHVHILRHLNIYLWKCAFCAHRGLQKYKMVDHIKKIHPGKPMSVRYLRVNVEAKVAQFLAQFNIIQNRKASLDEGLEVPFSANDTSHDHDDNKGTCQQSCSGGHHQSPGHSGPSSASSNYNHTLGSEELDSKIGCLYDFSDGVFYKCLVCPNQFQRKFAVHRHIIISHLKVALLTCSYCGMEGVEKHQMVDHILACHKGQPVNIKTNEVDLAQNVSKFLAKVAAGEDNADVNNTGDGLGSSKSSDSSKDYYNRMYRPFAFSKKPRSFGLSGSSSTKLKSPTFRFGNYKSSTPSTTKTTTPGKKNNLVDPDVIMLGRDALDRELSCLYQTRNTGQLRCLVCRWEFPRKYPLHRHIMLKHLKMNLVGCPYCPFEGVEKYNVSTHIKEEHKDKPINIKFTQPDVGGRVREFVDDMANVGGLSQNLIQKPESSNSGSRSSSPVVSLKRERDGDDDENTNGTNDSETRGGPAPPSLVVAMFGKKKNKVPPSPLTTSEDFVVKTEIEDEEFEEGAALDTHDDNDVLHSASKHKHGSGEDGEEENDDYNEEDDPGADRSNYDPEEDEEEEPDSSQFSTLRRPLVQSYAPGSYRSPAGGKPKALDVITKIKVLKSKDGPITKFYCEKCKFTSLHRSNVVRHIYKIHEKYQTHTCPICNYQTLSLMLMRKHTDREHPGQEYKEDAFTLNPPRTKPRTLMGPLSFQKRRQNLLHKKLSTVTPPRTTPQGPKQYACAYCHYETDTQDDILKHTKENHSQGDDSYSTARASSSQQNESDEDDQTSACWDGSKKAVKRKLQDGSDTTFKRKRRFVFEKGDELIQCGHCDARETSMGRMQDHMDWDHQGLPFNCKRIPAWRFVCKSCAVKTMATSKMKYHLNRHVNYRPYTCTNCGAFFPSPDQCRRHSRSQGHEEQYMYVRNPKKEIRVEELLEETRQLAIKVQEEAIKDPEFDIAFTDKFISQFQENRGNLKRSAPTGSNSRSAKKARAAADGDDSGDWVERKQTGKSAQTVGVEMCVTIKCYNCEFSAGTVSEVYNHHKEVHHDERFLWTELERGFTCDKTGEALPDCDSSVPNASTDVGYTTRMTLGAGNNTMRFKCKTCDFSSCVIQAMKSHLKSHQPKGFICPYCSRSFSGKEKLMRHQYCLHKGMALWVIHLRMSGTVGSILTSKKGGGPSLSSSVSRPESSPKSETAGPSVSPKPTDEDTASSGKRDDETE
ncbi:uncharacterized protein LOC101862563 isoform X2 [Aplysia californica]|uniref:Uncharacterized protein LOC101862563 isoform X2 n=1 Tax=Aplysia californica TaxID=6500 RepID=A0ABM1VNU7_APLCA|nr:uncharacterized protein LOC101862563 isoform X2 [Aplysia californica]